MAAGVLLDTSFLITLADKNRAHHEAARRYWQYFLENQIPIFLSAIVVSEFCIKQEIPPEMLRCCVVLPFNWDDAQRAAKLDWKRLRPAGWRAAGRQAVQRVLLSGVLLEARLRGDRARHEISSHEHVVVGGVVLRRCLRVVA